jgi:GNAT superfamily N-acetyltransferase
MREQPTRFLVLKDSKEDTVLGFLSWQVDTEDNEAVIYWCVLHLRQLMLSYELQLHPSLQRSGLGRQFMQVLEYIGTKLGLSKAMLTVFTSNTFALSFYTSLGYLLSFISG